MSERPNHSAYRVEALARGARTLPEPIARIARVFCGCGTPWEAWEWVRDYLAQQEAYHSDPLASPLPEPGGAEQVAIYLLDHLKLTEHGAGIGGAWLTADGRQALVFLMEYGPDWNESGAEWVDDEGVSWGIS